MAEATRWIGLAGPTASGKSDAAIALAAHWPIEIISVDSALVYRGMDIGTAKPDAATRAALPHHLIDLIDPRDAYSAAAFVADATRLIDAIRARGRLPLLVGGTMLYFKALQQGIAPMPAADAALRAQLDAEARERGWPALHAELARVDALTAARLAPHDAQRIQRALEVFRATGRPLSSFHADTPAGAAAAGGALIALEPSSRGWLHERIARRFDAMLAAGFIDELRQLRARGDLHTGLPSMRCVGYRQAWQLFDEGVFDEGRLDASDRDAAALALLRERGIAATRQLAKRQLTWLRSMPQRHVIACDAADANGQLQALVRRLMDTPSGG